MIEMDVFNTLRAKPYTLNVKAPGVPEAIVECPVPVEDLEKDYKTYKAGIIRTYMRTFAQYEPKRDEIEIWEV